MTGLSHSAWIKTLKGLVIMAVVLSAGGVPFAVLISGNCADGGRGGALAVAGSLAIFFIRLNVSERVTVALKDVVPDIGRMIGELRTGTKQATPPPDLETRVAALEQASQIDSAALEAANRKLAIATAVGTLTWGFGDVVAGWFLPNC